MTLSRRAGSVDDAVIPRSAVSSDRTFPSAQLIDRTAAGRSHPIGRQAHLQKQCARLSRRRTCRRRARQDAQLGRRPNRGLIGREPRITESRAVLSCHDQESGKGAVGGVKLVVYIAKDLIIRNSSM